MHWSWRLNILVPAVMSLKLFYKVSLNSFFLILISLDIYRYMMYLCTVFSSQSCASSFCFIFTQGAILRDANDEDVRTMSRSSSPSELLYGPLQFTIVMNWLGLFHFMSEEAAIIMAALGMGDGIAPLVGKYYGKHWYRMPLSSKKTLEGSIGGVFLGTIGGVYFFSYMLGIPVLTLQAILTLATIAMVVEGTSFNNCDNILLPVAMLYSLKYVKDMFV
jgi:dolichol kinase